MLAVACKKAGVSRQAVFKTRKSDSRFGRAYDEAKEFAYESIEEEAIRRARDGIQKPVFYRGVKIGETTVYSDRLLLHLLKSMRPAIDPPAADPAMSDSGELRITPELMAELAEDVKRFLPKDPEPDSNSTTGGRTSVSAHLRSADAASVSTVVQPSFTSTNVKSSEPSPATELPSVHSVHPVHSSSLSTVPTRKGSPASGHLGAEAPLENPKSQIQNLPLPSAIRHLGTVCATFFRRKRPPTHTPSAQPPIRLSDSSTWRRSVRGLTLAELESRCARHIEPLSPYPPGCDPGWY